MEGSFRMPPGRSHNLSRPQYGSWDHRVLQVPFVWYFIDFVIFHTGWVIRFHEHLPFLRFLVTLMGSLVPVLFRNTWYMLCISYVSTLLFCYAWSISYRASSSLAVVSTRGKRTHICLSCTGHKKGPNNSVRTHILYVHCMFKALACFSIDAEQYSATLRARRCLWNVPPFFPRSVLRPFPTNNLDLLYDLERPARGDTCARKRREDGEWKK